METLEREHPQFVEPLLLRDVYGLPYEEIAALVGAPLGTIKAQIHHGRKLVPPDAARRVLVSVVVRRRRRSASPHLALVAGCTPHRRPRAGRTQPDADPPLRPALRADEGDRPTPTTRRSTRR